MGTHTSIKIPIGMAEIPFRSQLQLVRCFFVVIFITFLSAFAPSAIADGNSGDGISTDSRYLSVVLNLILQDDEDDTWIRDPASPVIPTPPNPANLPAKTHVRVRSFEYETSSGLLIKTINDPDDAQQRTEITSSYDGWGNLTKQVISSTAQGIDGVQSRSIERGFDTRGQFMQWEKNDLNHKSSVLTDSRFGLPIRAVDKNGLVSEWSYNDFGNKEMAVLPSGARLATSYLYCRGIASGSASCPANAKYLIHHQPLVADGITSNGPWKKLYFDSKDRIVRIEDQGFNGELIFTDTEYLSTGEVSRMSRPYAVGSSAYWISYQYDGLQRIIGQYNPDGTSTSTTYSGVVTEFKNELNQKRTQIVDGRNNIIGIVDNENKKIVYNYNAVGQLWRTVDPQGNVVAGEYDTAGRKIKSVDPDLGVWTYQYNAYGELINQTSANKKSVINAYDVLGRLVSIKTEDLNSTWTFDNCSNGVGKICNIVSSNGYGQKFAYDAVGRISASSATVDEEYKFSFSYGDNGKISSVSYPAGLKLKYSYNKFGYLKDIKNAVTDELYWQVDAMDESGNVTVQTFGNGIVNYNTYSKETGRIKNIASTGGVSNLEYSFDALGNLTTREDRNQNISESFLYDGLGRLQNATVNSASTGIYNQVTSYSDIGNIDFRSGVGTYIYGERNNLPHALRTLKLENGATRYFEHDANGSVTREIQKDSSGKLDLNYARKIEYTSFDKPKTISHASFGSTNFMYGAHFERVKQISPSGTTVYIHPDAEGGMLYEKETRDDGVVEHRQYISANGVVVAVVKKTNGVAAIQYYHRDHLNSVVAVTNAAGAIVERLAYEPFGQRRGPTGQLDTANSIRGKFTARGFTSHEHIDGVGLINMNGRIYDPAIGRFLSADRNIPYADDLQSFNRYSYTRNNPLSMIDPSGYEDTRYENELKALMNDIVKNAEMMLQAVKEQSMQKVDVIGQKFDRAFSSETSDAGNVLYLLNRDRPIISDSQKNIGSSNNGEIQVYERKTTREAARERIYGTSDQVMGQWIEFDLLQELGRSAGASEEQLFWLGVIGMVQRPASVATWKSGKKFGHTFITHGAGVKNTNKLRGRAATHGTDQGQWMDNQKAADLLDSFVFDGEASIMIPPGLGQVIKADGSIVSEVGWAIVVPSKTGIRTSYPIIPKRK